MNDETTGVCAVHQAEASDGPLDRIQCGRISAVCPRCDADGYHNRPHKTCDSLPGPGADVEVKVVGIQL